MAVSIDFCLLYLTASSLRMSSAAVLTIVVQPWWHYTVGSVATSWLRCIEHERHFTSLYSKGIRCCTQAVHRCPSCSANPLNDS